MEQSSSSDDEIKIEEFPSNTFKNWAELAEKNVDLNDNADQGYSSPFFSKVLNADLPDERDFFRNKGSNKTLTTHKEESYYYDRLKPLMINQITKKLNSNLKKGVINNFKAVTIPDVEDADLDLTFTATDKISHIELEVHDEVRRSPNILNLELDYNDVEKSPHECCMLYLSGEWGSDVSFGDIEKMGAGDDLTPDYMMKMKITKDGVDYDCISLFELRTTRNPLMIDQEYNAKRQKYVKQLEMRSNFYLFYFVMVVNSMKIKTNLDINLIHASHILAHLNLGYDIQMNIGSSPKFSYLSEIDSKEIKKKKLKQRLIEVNEESKNKLPNSVLDSTNRQDQFLICHQMLNVWENYNEHQSVGAKQDYIMEMIRRMNNFENRPLTKKTNSDLSVEYERLLITPFRSEENKSFARVPLVLPKHIGFDCSEKDFLKSYSNNFATSSIGKIWNYCMEKGKSVAEDNFEDFGTDKLADLSSQKIKNSMQFKKMRDDIMGDKKNRYCIPIVTKDLSDDCLLNLISHGVFGKKLGKLAKFKEVYNSKKQENKLGFSMSVDTEDITNFIEKDFFELLKPAEFLGPKQSRFLGLVKKLNNLARLNLPGKRDDIIAFLDTMMKTKLHAWTSWIDELVEELTYVANRKYKGTQFIFKKLKNIDVCLLIRPTKKDGNVQFSLMMNKLSIDIVQKGNIFKHLIIDGSFAYTEFYSMNTKMLDHLQNISYKIIGNFCKWLTKYEVNYSDAQEYLITNNLNHLADPERMEECIKNTAFETLVYFEGRTQTSNTLSQFRYMYVEAIRQGLSPSKPLKVLTKLDKINRSRLTVWCIKRMIAIGREVDTVKPRLETKDSTLIDEEDEYSSESEHTNSEIGHSVDDDLSQEEWMNKLAKDKLINTRNFITMNMVPTFRILVELFYCGHLHNKDFTDKNRNNFKILEKFIVEELKIKNTRPIKNGYENTYDLKDHEWSLNFAFYVFENAKKYLYRRTSKKRSFEDEIEDEVLDDLIAETWIDYCTMKATADIKPENRSFRKMVEKSFGLPFDEVLAKKFKGKKKLQMNKRRKLIESMPELMEELARNEDGEMGLIPFFYIGDTIAIIERDGMLISIFMKDQQYGIREISVQPRASRINQSFTEKISRRICYRFPWEMLMRGMEKLMKKDVHYLRIMLYVRKTAEDRLIILHHDDSDDKKRWAQNFVMSLFAFFVSQLFPTNFKYICYRILNTFTKKMIEMPYYVLVNFIKNKSVDSILPELNKLKNEFLGLDKENLLLSEDDILFICISSMLQGLLHYSSSAMHACLALWVYTQSKMIYNHLVKTDQLSKLSSVVGTILISSDDSQTKMALIMKLTKMMAENKALVKKYKRNGVKYLSRSSTLNQVSGELLLMQRSEEKSKSNDFSESGEFNSGFEARDSLILPLVKDVYVAFATPPSSNFNDRQIYWAETVKNLLKNGGGHELCSAFAYLQSFLNYALIGLRSQVNLNDQICDDLMTLPIPQVGFYLYQPDYICGLFGFDFAEWNWVSQNNKIKLTYIELFNRKEKELDNLGRPSFSINILFGGNRRYLMFLDKMKSMSVDYNEYFAKHPEKLYYKSQDLITEKAKIYMKANDPGVKDSFTIKSETAINNSSSYIFFSPIIRLGEMKYEIKEEEVLVNKPIEEPTNLRDRFFSEKLSLFMKYKEELDLEIKGKREKKWTLTRMEEVYKFNFELVSLHQLIKELNEAVTSKIKNSNNNNNNEFFSYKIKEVMNLLFPTSAVYEDIIPIINSLPYSFMRKNDVDRLNKLINIKVEKDIHLAEDSMMQSCFYVWWGKNLTKINLNSYKKSFSRYSSIFPWLKTSYTETINNLDSPYYHSDVGLYRFLVSMNPGSKMLQMLAPIKKGLPLLDTIRLSIIHNQKPGWHMILKSEEELEKVNTTMTIYDESLTNKLNKFDKEMFHLFNNFSILVKFLPNKIRYSIFEDFKNLIIQKMLDLDFDYLIDYDDLFIKMKLFLYNKKSIKEIKLLSYTIFYNYRVSEDPETDYAVKSAMELYSSCDLGIAAYFKRSPTRPVIYLSGKNQNQSFEIKYDLKQKTILNFIVTDYEGFKMRSSKYAELLSQLNWSTTKSIENINGKVICVIRRKAYQVSIHTANTKEELCAPLIINKNFEVDIKELASMTVEMGKDGYISVKSRSKEEIDLGEFGKDYFLYKFIPKYSEFSFEKSKNLTDMTDNVFYKNWFGGESLKMNDVFDIVKSMRVFLLIKPRVQLYLRYSSKNEDDLSYLNLEEIANYFNEMSINLNEDILELSKENMKYLNKDIVDSLIEEAMSNESILEEYVKIIEMQLFARRLCKGRLVDKYGDRIGKQDISIIEQKIVAKENMEINDEDVLALQMAQFEDEDAELLAINMGESFLKIENPEIINFQGTKEEFEEKLQNEPGLLEKVYDYGSMDFFGPGELTEEDDKISEMFTFQKDAIYERVFKGYQTLDLSHRFIFEVTQVISKFENKSLLAIVEDRPLVLTKKEINYKEGIYCLDLCGILYSEEIIDESIQKMNSLKTMVKKTVIKPKKFF